MTYYVKSIERKGIVFNIDNGIATVKVSCSSACGSCHAKGVCGESDDKFMEVKLNGDEVNLGDEVIVSITQKQGNLAVLLGYVFPFILIIITLIIAITCGINELIASMVSISSVSLYYIFLYLFRKKIDNSFKLSILSTVLRKTSDF